MKGDVLAVVFTRSKEAPPFSYRACCSSKKFRAKKPTADEFQEVVLIGNKLVALLSSHPDDSRDIVSNHSEFRYVFFPRFVCLLL